MARRIGPDGASRGARTIVRGYFHAKVGRPVQLWADEAATVPADVLWLDGSPIPHQQPAHNGGRGPAPTVVVDSNSLVPEFQFPPDDVDTIWATCDGGPVWQFHARVDQRLDDLDGRVTTVEDVAAAAETPAGAQQKADAAGAAAIGLSAQREANLADLTNGAAARTNLGLGTASTRNVGTTAGTVAAGDDARLSDPRTPTGHAATHAQAGSDPVTPAAIGAVPTSRSVTAGAGLTGGGDLTANRTLAVAYGSTAGTAAAGNDPRLSDARTPTGHAATHAPGGSDPMAVDAAAGVGSLRTLGTGATQAAPGNDDRFGLESLPVTSGATWTGVINTGLAGTARTVHATLTGNTTLNLPTPSSTVSYTVTLVLTQDATGGRTLTLPQCKFAYGVAPVLSTAGGATDVLHLMWTGVQWIALMGAPAVA